MAQHGSGGDEKIRKAGRQRANNTPPAAGEPLPGPGKGRGSATGPTRKAQRVNAERHAQEARSGHLAAGLKGRRRAVDQRGKRSR
jgi:hypothetical protein